jgi:hypothetical protein
VQPQRQFKNIFKNSLGKNKKNFYFPSAQIGLVEHQGLTLCFLIPAWGFLNTIFIGVGRNS